VGGAEGEDTCRAGDTDRSTSHSGVASPWCNKSTNVCCSLHRMCSVSPSLMFVSIYRRYKSAAYKANEHYTVHRHQHFFLCYVNNQHKKDDSRKL
jgi:hypothetical protein